MASAIGVRILYSEALKLCAITATSYLTAHTAALVTTKAKRDLDRGFSAAVCPSIFSFLFFIIYYFLDFNCKFRN